MSIRSVKQIEKLLDREAKTDQQNIERAEKDLKRAEKALKRITKVGGS